MHIKHGPAHPLLEWQGSMREHACMSRMAKSRHGSGQRDQCMMGMISSSARDMLTLRDGIVTELILTEPLTLTIFTSVDLPDWEIISMPQQT